ncbi:MAG: hypothetical protein M3348_14865, partial [Acidobacteriota bacterium]|nr:hypothetical protein [Acidobacteriota bacterium]
SNSFWVRHQYESEKRVEGVVARYRTQYFGMSFSASLPDISKAIAALYCRDYKSNGLDTPPGVIRNSNGTLSPGKAYQWVEPDNPANLCVRLKPGIIKNANGTLSPAPGYRWVNPGDRDDFRVERIP